MNLHLDVKVLRSKSACETFKFDQKWSKLYPGVWTDLSFLFESTVVPHGSLKQFLSTYEEWNVSRSHRFRGIYLLVTGWELLQERTDAYLHQLSPNHLSEKKEAMVMWDKRSSFLAEAGSQQPIGLLAQHELKYFTTTSPLGWPHFQLQKK